MKNLFSSLGLALLIAGCASPKVEPMQTADGKQGFVVSCNGSADSWATCYKAATSACPSGKYSVIDRNESSTPTAYGPMVRRNLIAECKN